MHSKLLFNFVIFSTALFSVVVPVVAAPPGGDVQGEMFDQLKTVAASSGQDDTPQDPREIIVNIIKVVLGLLGTIFFALMVYAGFLWMTAAGDEGKVDKSKTLIKQAVIGLVIILAAYSITSFAIKIATQTQDDPLWSWWTT